MSQEFEHFAADRTLSDRLIEEASKDEIVEVTRAGAAYRALPGEAWRHSAIEIL